MMLTSVLTISAARSQGINNNFFTKSESKLFGHISTELDPSLSIALGVGNVFTIKERKVLTSFTINSPLALVGNSVGVAIGGTTFLIDNEWDVKTTLDFRAKYFSNDLSQGSAYSLNIIMNPGYYQDKWFTSLMLTYRRYLATYRKHTSDYKTVFPEVKDGWYSNDSGLMFFGIAGGYCFENVELNASLTAKLPDSFEDYAPLFLPVYFGLGVNVHF